MFLVHYINYIKINWKKDLLCCSSDVDNQTQRAERDSLEKSFGNLLSNNDSKR